MSNATILIVDDEEGIVKLCRRLLERAGFTVLSTSKPLDGIALAQQEEIDLLLVDIRMPEIDGFQVIETARSYQPDMAVVIMTGYGTLETAIKALRQGVDGLILKPFKQGKELVETVYLALQERQHKEEMARLRAIRPLLDMTETLFSETRYQAQLELILNSISGHLRCENSAVYQRLPGENMLRLLASHGKTLPEEDASTQSGLLSRANNWKVSVWANRDGPADSSIQAILEKAELGAVMCSPVLRGEGTLVFMAGRDPGEPGYQLADLDMFGILARQADVALENSRLYDELRAYVRQVEESQRALTQSEKMAAVGRLTASIAHEINNPLQAVSNCLHLAEREELEPHERENYLNLAKEELDRLMVTVRRMLDFYRPGAVQRKAEDIPELVRLVLELLEPQLNQGNVEIELNIIDEFPLIPVVSNQIQQVFFNLVLNAMEAMPEGGKLMIRGNKYHNNVEIVFEDTGSGVPRDQRENIFEPFMSTRENGNGLGLSVSYGILTAHGGSLNLIKGKGSGACFRVSLPLEEAK